MAFDRLKNTNRVATGPTNPQAAPAPAAPAAPAPTPEARPPVLNQASSPPPAPAPAPVTVQAEVVPERAVAVTAPAPSAVSTALFGEGISMSAGLLAISDVQDGGGGGPMFPVLTVAGGASGGAFVPLQGTPQEIADQLPQGRRPVEGVFLAYRSLATAWPISYQERQAAQAQSAGQGGDTDKPCWSAVIPCTNAEAGRALALGCQKYQFTKGVNKPRWNFAESQIGHIRPTLQLLVYLPTVDDVIIVETVSHYSSWKRSIDALKRHVDPRTGALNQFPCSIRSVSSAEMIGANSVMIHTLDITTAVNETGRQWWEAFNQWRAALANNPDVTALLREWVSGGDRPLTPEVIERLNRASTFSA